MSEEQPLQRLDAQIEARVQAIRAEQPWWPCRRGCGDCCRHLAQPLAISAAEWDRVDAAVANLPAPTRGTIAQRIATLLQQITDQTLDSAVVCPYLNDAEGACWIYDARPIACRTYGFFVARDHDQYCNQIEVEVKTRSDTAIVWGNAEVIRHEVEQMSGTPIPFDHHYRDRQDRSQ